MKKIIIFIILSLLLSEIAVYSYQVHSIEVSKRRGRVICRIVDEKKILQDTLVKFITDQDENKIKEFDGIIFQNSISLKNNIKSYYEDDSISYAINLRRNKLICHGRINIGKYKNHPIYHEYNIGAEKLIQSINNEYNIIGNSLNSYPHFKEQAVKALTMLPLNAFISKSEVEEDDDFVTAEFTIKDKVESFSNKTIITPNNLNICFKYKRNSNKIPRVALKFFRTSIDRTCLKMDIPVSPKASCNYNTVITLYESIDLSDSLRKYSDTIKSYRYNITYRVSQKNNIIATGSSGGVGYHTSTKQARIRSSVSAGTNAAKSIITDLIYISLKKHILNN